MPLTNEQRIAAEYAIIDAALAEIQAITQSGERSWSAGDQSVDANAYVTALEQRIENAKKRIRTLHQRPYMIRSRKMG